MDITSSQNLLWGEKEGKGQERYREADRQTDREGERETDRERHEVRTCTQINDL
jgi:hypothetical protein